ncbi:hypothetical protein IID62_01415 [candidate division KSB1 bacterium]|nr:hypothetical protein [candidate division KSB1 bacterium]
MTQSTESAQLLIESCLDGLGEIAQLSRDIRTSVDNDETESLEPLFAQRSIEIEKITGLEVKLGKMLNSKHKVINNPEIKDYKQKRESLFHDIQEIDRQVNLLITASKETVLSEMKELYRGRKMNDGYLTIPAYSSAFIDTKE